MIDFKRNNLDMGPSPYLQQHKENPIHWQEWKEEVLEYARENNKLILLSIGYSTCHWCHAMAGETFEDQGTADYLNDNFVSIKVDKEQRPDIDGFFMDFISKTRGNGGWPLNAILKPDLSPVYALTYAPAKPKYGSPSFLAILKEVKRVANSYEYIEEEEYEEEVDSPSIEYIIEMMGSYFDDRYGGFGSETKFPSHSTLLFLLTYYGQRKHKKVLPVIEKTLNSIVLKGLHDHLQGGFFRYCVDRKWKIPHFEKMLYDQALLLWILSYGYEVLGKKEYKVVADKIIGCLEETFQNDGLFYAAHDADTLHVEGDTYVWSWDELRKVLSSEELEELAGAYEISPKGNFEGKIHLIRKNYDEVSDIEEKLLEIRRARTQPFVDKKIITSWNALTGIGLVIHWKATGDKSSLNKAEELLKKILKLHWKDESLVHSSLDKKPQDGEFMRDYAALLLLATYLHEEGGEYEELIERLRKKLMSFKEGDRWIESKNPDFREVEAQDYDASMPSSISLAELALLRCEVLFGEKRSLLNLKAPLDYDFHNMVSLLSKK